MWTPSPSDELLKRFDKMKVERQTAYMICVWKYPHVELETKKGKDVFDEPYVKDFISDLKKCKQPRYGLIDWNNRIMCLSFIPDTSKPKFKMIYATMFEQIVQQFEGVRLKARFNSNNELTEDALFCKMRYNYFYERKAWKIRRVIWIGYYKNNNVHSGLIAKLPQDVIKLVLSYVTSTFERYKPYRKYEILI